MIRTRLFLTALVPFILQSCQNTGGSAGQEELRQPPFDTSAYLALGEEITTKTFDTLSTALRAQIAATGFARAIDYCRVEAYSITDAYAREGIGIRRTSSKYRNPKNQPDSLEARQLNDLQKQMDEGQVPTPRVLRMPDGSIHYFKPILLQPLCLNCHGQPGEHIQAETLAAIRQVYPDDRATGYAAGQVRGAWHVSFAARDDD